MERARIHGVVLSGHKGAAVEVPFDPAERFGLEAAPLRPGRRGHRVRASRGSVRFETEIVPRSRRFWLLLPRSALAALVAKEGDRIEILLEPLGRSRARVSRRRAAPRSSSRGARRGG